MTYELFLCKHVHVASVIIFHKFCKSCIVVQYDDDYDDVAHMCDIVSDFYYVEYTHENMQREDYNAVDGLSTSVRDLLMDEVCFRLIENFLRLENFKV